ncbi:MAG: ATP synthase F1 subunit gamma [Bacteroidales bacterium]|nr:ATP synthase F1 subunit gamma [Bacteroidales bacterium]
MANLKDLRVRINSVKSTRQITSAMKMVAAARLRKAQNRIIQLRPYANKLHKLISTLSNHLNEEEGNNYSTVRDEEKILIILITSNRGLCGAFNSVAIKNAINLADNVYRSQLNKGNVHFLAIGKKGADFLKRKKYNLVDSKNELFDSLSFQTVAPLAENIMKQFINEEYDKIELVYNQFKNAAVQNITTEQFLPVVINEEEEGKHLPFYIFEPDKERIILELIPKSLKIQFYKAIIDSFVSENGARMTAMHKATDNATELIRDLNLEYNKARQNAITKELLDIVGGAEALNK